MKNRRQVLVRLTGLVAALALCLGQLPPVQAVSPVKICDDKEWEVLKIVNKERFKAGLTPLSTNADMQKIAGIRAPELVKLFSHTRPDGRTCYTVFDEVDIPFYWYQGENIAAGQNTAEYVMNGWMNSPGHKANILHTAYTHIGIGYHYNAKSTYKHNWVQLFMGYCTTTDLSVQIQSAANSYPLKTKIDDMDIALKLECDHGTSYMPVIAEMCKGYKSGTSGEQTVTVKLGTRSTTFTVTLGEDESTGTGKTSIKNAAVTGIKNKTYTGKKLTQSPKVVVNGKTLKKNTDYTLSYSKNTNAGKAAVTIKGKGKYTGSVKKTFTIKKRSIKKLSFNKISNKKYTGKAIKPKITIKYNKKKLDKSQYSVKYSNNKKRGTAKVTITGKGNFTGTVTRTFKIVR